MSNRILVVLMLTAGALSLSPRISLASADPQTPSTLDAADATRALAEQFGVDEANIARALPTFHAHAARVRDITDAVGEGDRLTHRQYRAIRKACTEAARDLRPLLPNRAIRTWRDIATQTLVPGSIRHGYMFGGDPSRQIILRSGSGTSSSCASQGLQYDWSGGNCLTADATAQIRSVEHVVDYPNLLSVLSR